MGAVLPVHRVQKELSNDCISFSLSTMHFGDSGRGVAKMSKQLPVNSKLIPPWRKVLIMGHFSRTASLWQAVLFKNVPRNEPRNGLCMEGFAVKLIGPP